MKENKICPKCFGAGVLSSSLGMPEKECPKCEGDGSIETDTPPIHFDPTGEPDMKKFMDALNGCYSTIGKQHQVIQAQENYIIFLGIEISRTSTYLHVHNMKTPDEIVEAGKLHREIIEKAKEKLKP